MEDSVPMEEDQPPEMASNTFEFEVGAHDSAQNVVHHLAPEHATSLPAGSRSAEAVDAEDGYVSSPHRSDNNFCSTPCCSVNGYERSPHSSEVSHSSLPHYAEDGYCSLSHGSNGGYGSLPHGSDDGYGSLSHGSDDSYHTLSHSSAGNSSADGYVSLCHSSEDGNCSSLHSYADGYGSSSSPHCSQHGHDSVPHASENGNISSPYSLDDKNGSSDDGCGSLGHCEHCYGCSPQCSVEPDEALSETICVLEPCIHGATIRGQLTDQEAASGSKIRSKEGSGRGKNEHKRERVQIGRSFQLAVDAHDWHLAESLIPLADTQRLNDGLCIAVDSVWFLCTHEELYGATRLMEKLVEAGAEDFTRAALRTSFLASCVSACRSKTLSLADTVSILAERLHERLQECSGYEILKAEAAVKVKRFAEWALKCIGSHSRARRRGHDGEYTSAHNSSFEAQLQLRAFKRFLELAGNRLTGKDYTEAFDAACFPLTLFSTAIDSGWASGIAASAMQGLLGMLVEGGADNVNQCCLEAARFGSTELLRILLQIAQRNGIEVDVDLALGFASHYCKIGTMECLVDDGNAVAFLGPLMRAADRNCMPVVKWFVERGCRDMELCLALTAAASSSRVEVAEYLINCIPLNVLRALSLDILKAAAERSAGCLKGIAFLLQSDFLCSPKATYAVADSISKLEDESISAELKFFCKDEWSSEAFLRGRKAGEDHYLNVLRVIHHGSSPLQLKELPLQLQVAIAYFPLYKECAANCGILLSQWLRGQLVEAALRLDAGKGHSAKELMEFDKGELLAILESRLPSFFVADS